jgi:hypothetical protein
MIEQTGRLATERKLRATNVKHDQIKRLIVPEQQATGKLTASALVSL